MRHVARRAAGLLLLAAALLCPNHAGADGTPRVAVDWAFLPLSAPTGRPGYTSSEESVSDAVRRRIDEEGSPRRPTAVWLHRTSAGQEEPDVRAVPPGDEESAIALGRFRTLRVDVDALRSEELRKTWSDTPAFLFFDPDGAEVGRVAGAPANDARAFEVALDAAWRESFTAIRSQFLRRMKGILDAKDALAERQASFRAKRAALGDEPTARELRELEREVREIERDLEEILAEEHETLRSVRLRPRYASN